MKKFEQYLLRVNARQKWMIYASAVLIIVLVLNALSAPLSEELVLKEAQIENLQSGIAANTSAHLKKEIAQKTKGLMDLNDVIEKEKEQVSALMSSLYKIKYAFFNEKEFANTLDAMLKKSLRSNLTIAHIKTLELPKEANERLLKHKKRIEIIGFGEYKEIVAFIAHIEQQDLLLSFNTIKIEAGDKHVNFTLLFDIYGIGL